MPARLDFYKAFAGYLCLYLLWQSFYRRSFITGNLQDCARNPVGLSHQTNIVIIADYRSYSGWSLLYFPFLAVAPLYERRSRAKGNRSRKKSEQNKRVASAGIGADQQTT